jgi:secreted Zn-dependent insulinase-like peptidase
LIESLLEDEFFDVLRTKEQLGYYVSCSQRNTRGIPGLLFTIESSKYTLDVVEPKIFKFIEDYFYEKLTEKVYQDYLKGLINRKSEPFKDLTEDSRFLMGALKDYSLEENRPFHWHRRADALKFLQEEMTFERVKSTYHRLLIGEKSRRIAIFRTYPPKYFHMIKDSTMEEAYLNDEDRFIDESNT